MVARTRTDARASRYFITMESGLTPAEGVAVAGARRAANVLRFDLASLWSVDRIPAAVTAIAFVALFALPFATLVRDWWSLPEAGHGLLLAPVAVWLAWRSGLRAGAAS